MTLSWQQNKRYNSYSSYLNTLFDVKVQKISLDAGFTCPNRDGLLSSEGCHFCNNTFKPDYCTPEKSVTKQLEEGIAFFSKKYKKMQYLAYFQAYTNTYSEIETLKRLYNEALAVPGVRGLIIGTRPDCMDDDILLFLQELSKTIYVFIEFGIESTLDKTLNRINRKHIFKQTIDAFNNASKAGLQVGGHLILGLPGETREEVLTHAKTISQLPIHSLKLHQLQILKGTRMEREFREKPNNFLHFTIEDYVTLVVDFLELLRPDIVVERFASVVPSDLLISPKWNLKNFEITHKVEKELKRRDSWQGKLRQ